MGGATRDAAAQGNGETREGGRRFDECTAAWRSEWARARGPRVDGIVGLALLSELLSAPLAWGGAGMMR